MATPTTDVARRPTESLGPSGGPALGDVAMSLEDFITFFSLPQRAKVICGYWEPADDALGWESSREFAADELIQLAQVVCPFVRLIMVPEVGSGRAVGISLSTRFQNVRFRVVSHRELTASTKPRVFAGVAEMVDVWPHTVKALAGHRGDEREGTDRMFDNGDRLRLVRIACLPDGRRMLECKLLRGNMRLLQLPLTYRGNFAEVDDPKGYTLHDLVSIARVPRTLKIHRGGGSVADGDDASTVTVPGIPAHFDGFITLEKPQLFVQVHRVQRLADGAEAADPGDIASGGGEKPFLVPIDCPIEIALREDTYQGCDFSALKLKEIVKKYATGMPIVVRITDWKEETSVLQLHLVRPGHQLILIRQESRSTVLVRDKARNRQYMLPVDHKGIFVRLNAIREDCGLPPRRAPLDLKSLEDASFPFDVRFTNDDNPYSNLPDALLPVDSTLTFEAFVEEDRTAVVAKLADGIICKCFHLPVRTGLRMQFERRWPSATSANHPVPFANHRMSEYDTFAEEVNARVYNKLMKIYSDYEWVMADVNPYPSVKSVSAVEHLSTDLKTPQKWMKDFEMSADGYLKPCAVQPPIPPIVRPRGPKGDSVKKSSTLGHASITRRRNVPPPPTALRESAPPVPSRSTRMSCLSIDGGSRTNSLTRGEGARAKAPPPLPPLPPPPPPPMTLVTPPELNDDDDSGSSGDSDAQSYSYIDVETLEDCVRYRQAVFPGTLGTDGVSIPSDGNVSNFSADQMLLFLREVHAPVSTISAWRQLRVNGQDFAKMTDRNLEEFNIESIVVQFFRDRSRMHVLLQL